jgi:hypothetical protein
MTGAASSHPSANGLVLRVVRRETIKAILARYPGYSAMQDPSFQGECTQCESLVIVSGLARTVASDARRPLVLICDVCHPTPPPDPKTVKYEDRPGGTP